MAITFDSVNIEGLRLTHLEQLYNYLQNAETDGFYYGNKEQFLKRHGELKKWLEGVIEKASNSEYVIPRRRKT